jgi:hypothetical protein
VSGDLHREGPHPARGADDQDALAWLDPSSAQALQRGHRDQRHRGGLLEGEIPRLGRQAALVDGDVLGEGSTSVPGLAAKPIIDIDLTVADPAREQDYVPALEAIGFRLVIREPWWYGHRTLAADEPRCNLHVFGFDSPEPIKHRSRPQACSNHEPICLAAARVAQQPSNTSEMLNQATPGPRR